MFCIFHLPCQFYNILFSDATINNSLIFFQRLEFLGDAVLDYLITSYLFSLYPKLKPGQLTDLRSVSVNNESFANVAVDRHLHKFLMCDSCHLNEAIEKYVDFISSSPDRGLFEGPKCPKVRITSCCILCPLMHAFLFPPRI